MCQFDRTQCSIVFVRRFCTGMSALRSIHCNHDSTTIISVCCVQRGWFPLFCFFFFASHSNNIREFFIVFLFQSVAHVLRSLVQNKNSNHSITRAVICSNMIYLKTFVHSEYGIQYCPVIVFDPKCIVVVCLASVKNTEKFTFDLNETGALIIRNYTIICV